MKTIFLLAMLSLPAHAAQTAHLALSDCQTSAMNLSPQIKSALAEAAAARDAAENVKAALFPRVALEGALRYTGVIPQINLATPAGTINKQLGDNWNYSIGPSAYWTLFDNNGSRAAWESARKTAAAKAEDLENARRQVTLSARLAYFQVQLALEQTYLLGDQLKLAISQHEDISLNARAGTKSRLDELMSNQEVLARRRELLQARAELSGALRELAAITGREDPFDPSLALDARMNYAEYGGIEPPTALVSAEPAASLLSDMEKYSALMPDLESPSLHSLEMMAQSYRAAAESFRADKSPRVLLSARSSLDYPNGPSLYSYGQNTAGISVSLPLFENGRSDARSREQQNRAQSADERRQELARGIRRDFFKAHDAFSALKLQQDINTEAVKEASEAAALTYSAYKAGRSTWLEVQDANLRVLAAKSQSANTDAQMLIQLALMASAGR
ncbi:MAG: TolC family protein [Elusimicrobiales bacterium]|nr:TolC family protein [Elusimicrobiales bacterium]